SVSLHDAVPISGPRRTGSTRRGWGDDRRRRPRPAADRTSPVRIAAGSRRHRRLPDRSRSRPDGRAAERKTSHLGLVAPAAPGAGASSWRADFRTTVYAKFARATVRVRRTTVAAGLSGRGAGTPPPARPAPAP